MPIGLLFWLIFVVWILFGAFACYEPSNRPHWSVMGGGLIVAVLLFILGWRVFGFVIQA